MSTTKNAARHTRMMTDDEIRAALSDSGPVGVRRERLTAVKRELEARQMAGHGHGFGPLLAAIEDAIRDLDGRGVYRPTMH